MYGWRVTDHLWDVLVETNVDFDALHIETNEIKVIKRHGYTNFKGSMTSEQVDHILEDFNKTKKY